MNKQSYTEILDYLYSFLNRNLKYRADGRTTHHFDLNRVRQLMSALGNPQEHFPKIHVAGTKGKGTVSMMCASALQASDYRVGLYTSPHLEDYAERIRINKQPISHDELIHLVQEIKPLIESIPRLTTFEITTALAFLYFARQHCTAVVVEVGFGGRLDATNVIQPIVSVITSISYDHTHVLGHTLTEIAFEKAGIIKPGIPVILAPQKEEARDALEKKALKQQSPCFPVEDHYHYTPLSYSLEEQSFSVISSLTKENIELTIPLLGDQHIENAVTAYAALRVVHDHGLPTTIQAIQTGFHQAYWSGRFTILRKNPPVILDGAHNRDSIARLYKTLGDYFPTQQVILVFGTSTKKDITGMFEELLPHVRQLILTQANHPRALKAADLAQHACHYPCSQQIVPTVDEALQEALQRTTPSSLILVTGSLFVVAEALRFWKNNI